jgi:hypothetical protein
METFALLLFILEEDKSNVKARSRASIVCKEEAEDRDFGCLSTAAVRDQCAPAGELDPHLLAALVGS